MMKLIILALAGICLAQAAHVPNLTADKTFLQKQKNIYELFWHVDQPTIYHPELYQKARTFNIEEHVDSYTDQTAVTEFLELWKHGMLPRGQVFSIMYPHLHEEAIALYRLLFTAKDFETFYNTAVWARFHVNEQMYVYVLSVAVLHHPECKHIRIPPLYEILPNFFFNEDVLHQTYRIGMGDQTVGVKKSIGGVDNFIIHTNYSGWYLVRHGVPEQQLTYFTEDVGLNSYYYLFNHDMPIWMSSEQYSLPKDIRGELYLFGHKQLLIRYYLERLSNDLGEIDYIDWQKEIPHGYHPNMHFHNGLPFPQREDDMVVPLHMQKYVQKVQELETRIGQIIDSGYIEDVQGKRISVYTPEGLNHLGNIIQGNADAPNIMLYGHLDTLCRRILGFGLEPASKYQVAPSALEIYSTSMRDPVFYSMYKRIIYFLHRYKGHLPAYTRDELTFPGVKIESVTVDKLMTFFEHFDSLLNNAIAVRNHKEAQNTLIKARQHRLNHKPFTYHITVNSDKNVKGVVRIFLGPKFDEHGHELDITENYMNFMQLDEFVVDLKTGLNKVERQSHESIYVCPDEVPSDVFYKKIQKALEGGESFTYSTQNYGFPDRLLLPKGKKEGMPFKLFVHVAPFEQAKSFKAESTVWGSILLDGRPMGYPLDRHVHPYKFVTPNMHLKDVYIFHKQLEELNVTV